MISRNKGGLSNRIKSFVSCLHASDDARIYWPILDNYNKEHHILNCSFDRLFTNDVETKVFPTQNFYESHCLYINDSDCVPPNFNTFQSRCKSKPFTKTDRNNRNIDFMYNAIPEGIKHSYIKLFQYLTPVDSILNDINRFSQHFSDKTVSVHIRSWNRANENGRRNDLFNLKGYIDLMDKLPSEYNFFVCSDSQEVLDFFKKHPRFVNRIITYDRKTPLDNSRDTPEGVIDDLTELYLCSRNNKIIGSHFSTYTEVAWWLGGCTQDIQIV